jgi:hypothetical protein
MASGAKSATTVAAIRHRRRVAVVLVASLLLAVAQPLTALLRERTAEPSTTTASLPWPRLDMAM